MPSMQSVALANQKGGVGKTTTAIHVAHGLALAGNRVALFDLDPQGNATVALQGMEGGVEADGPLAVLAPVAERLWMLPSTGAWGAPEDRVTPDLAKLQGLVEELRSVVDWLVIDCPPRLDDWGWAGIQLCDQVVVPVQAEFFAMHGLSQMLASLETAAERYQGKARLRGVLPTMVDLGDALSREVLEDLRKNLGATVMQSVVLRDSNIVEAASHGKSVFVHCPWSCGALCYAELVQELIHGGS